MILYFGDLAVGDAYHSTGRTVTEADIVAFAGLSGDFNPLHTDAEWVAENTAYSGRIAHGLLVLAISSGLRTPNFDELAIEAYVNVDRRMSAPTYPGDTLRMTQTISDLRPSSSRPGSGIVTVTVTVTNQNGTVVQTGADVLLVSSGADR